MSPVFNASLNEFRRFALASSLMSKVFTSVITIFSGFLSLLESFSRSLFIEDLMLEKFLRFDLIFKGSSSRCQIFFISVSVSMETTSFIEFSEI